MVRIACTAHAVQAYRLSELCIILEGGDHMKRRYCFFNVDGLLNTSSDWKKPFSIRIDRNINWNRPYQSLVVKVRDVAGQGGIWQPVMLGCREGSKK